MIFFTTVCDRIRKLSAAWTLNMSHDFFLMMSLTFLLLPTENSFAQENINLENDPLTFSGEVFSSYQHSQTKSQTFSQFQLDRSEFGVQSWEEADWGGELRLESLRSAGPNSLIGIDGDSLILRVKRAWGFRKFQGQNWKLQTRFGLIPDPWHLVIMNTFPLRGLGPSQGEREGLQDTSDLGLSFQFTFRKRK